MCLVLKWWKHHENMSSGVQEGFLEEEASQLTPERQLELEEKHKRWAEGLVSKTWDRGYGKQKQRRLEFEVRMERGRGTR